MLDIATLVALSSAFISCGAAVFALLFVRRGGDADVKSDLEELALLVDRMAKTQRREKMARVRRSTKEPDPSEVAQIPLDHVPTGKAALRAKLARLRG